MRELRAITERMRETFERAGYGEVHTPALEYEDVLRRGDDARRRRRATAPSTSRATCSRCART